MHSAFYIIHECENTFFSWSELEFYMIKKPAWKPHDELRLVWSLQLFDTQYNKNASKSSKRPIEYGTVAIIATKYLAVK